MSPKSISQDFPGLGPILWPELGDTAFSPGDPRLPGTAVLDWLGDRWNAYADGYKRAALIVGAHFDHKEQDEDRVVFPLIALWRHYLELKLKALIPDLRDLASLPAQKVGTSHDLAHLWRLAEPALRQMGDSEELEAVGAVISEFIVADSSGQYFRYPVTTAGVSTLSNGLQSVDLKHLHTTMLSVANFLEACEAQADGLREGMREAVSAAAEAEADWEAEMNYYAGDQGDY